MMTKTLRVARTAALALFVSLSLSSIARSQAPATLYHQGVLEDESGTPLDGNFVLTFRLYDAATDGSVVWSEAKGIELVDGVFHVTLGQSELLDEIPFDRSYWLSVSVNDGPELEPRMPLTSVPYSMHARSIAEGAVTASSFDASDGSSGQILTIDGDAVVWKDPEVVEAGVPGLHALEQSDGSVQLLLNRTDRIGSEWFGIRAPVEADDDLGGVYVETNGEGIAGARPFYGYAHNGEATAWHELNGPAGEWQLVLDLVPRLSVDVASGDLTTSSNVTASGNVTATGNVSASGDVTASGTVSATGNVTTSAFLESTGDGVRFPDGTVQTSAAEELSGLTAVQQSSGALLLLNRTNRIGAEWFGIRAPVSSENQWGGMYMETNGDGIVNTKPFYGYAHNNAVKGWHELDGATNEWRLIIGANTRFKVDGDDGNVYADGTFNPGGADVAEAFEVEGMAASYEPGDVLVISTERNRTVALSTETYSARVAGVYAAKPGVLLSENGVAGIKTDQIPMGVVGVVPTKVSIEGGPIRRGDLLVTSSTPGHAMRANPKEIGFGTVIGKALEPFEGAERGKIEVLVSIR